MLFFRKKMWKICRFCDFKKNLDKRFYHFWENKNLDFITIKFLFQNLLKWSRTLRIIVTGALWRHNFEFSRQARNIFLQPIRLLDPAWHLSISFLSHSDQTLLIPREHKLRISAGNCETILVDILCWTFKWRWNVEKCDLAMFHDRRCRIF